MVCRWRIFRDFLHPAFAVSHVHHMISDLHSKFPLRQHNVTMCGGMGDIQSATAEIRLGKNQEERKKEERNRTKI